MQQPIDLERVTRALRQNVRKNPDRQDRLETTLTALPRIVAACGEYSQTRRMATLIGNMLLSGQHRIVVPCCPDYSHDGSRYTFRNLHGGVSLLALKHIAFLEKIAMLLPNAEATFLYADHEADDIELLRVTGKTKDEFTVLVRDSIAATQEKIATHGWTAYAMTDLMPDLVTEEEKAYRWITENPDFKRRIDSETMDRAEMYFKIRRTLTDAEMRERTVRTAAQYVAFGRFAAEQKCFVLNHTTVNLSWYLQTEVAILHNPVSIY